jgi:hypothetical protein
MRTASCAPDGADAQLALAGSARPFAAPIGRAEPPLPPPLVAKPSAPSATPVLASASAPPAEPTHAPIGWSSERARTSACSTYLRRSSRT